MFFPLSLLSLLVTPLILPACSAVPTISHNDHPSARSPHSQSHSLSAHLTSLWDLVTCPSPPGTPSSAPRLAGYTITFTNYTAVPSTRSGSGLPPPPPPIGAATNGDGFMRYTLSNTTTTVGCLEACDAEDKCAFVNAYKDARFGEQAAREGEEAGKHGRGVWTCALYNKCPWGTEE